MEKENKKNKNRKPKQNNQKQNNIGIEIPNFNKLAFEPSEINNKKDILKEDIANNKNNSNKSKKYIARKNQKRKKRKQNNQNKALKVTGIEESNLNRFDFDMSETNKKVADKASLKENKSIDNKKIAKKQNKRRKKGNQNKQNKALNKALKVTGIEETNLKKLAFDMSKTDYKTKSGENKVIFNNKNNSKTKYIKKSNQNKKQYNKNKVLKQNNTKGFILNEKNEKEINTLNKTKFSFDKDKNNIKTNNSKNSKESKLNKLKQAKFSFGKKDIKNSKEFKENENKVKENKTNFSFDKNDKFSFENNIKIKENKENKVRNNKKLVINKRNIKYAQAKNKNKFSFENKASLNNENNENKTKFSFDTFEQKEENKISNKNNKNEIYKKTILQNKNKNSKEIEILKQNKELENKRNNLININVNINANSKEDSQESKEAKFSFSKQENKNNENKFKMRSYSQKDLNFKESLISAGKRNAFNFASKSLDKNLEELGEADESNLIKATHKAGKGVKKGYRGYKKGKKIVKNTKNIISNKNNTFKNKSLFSKNNNVISENAENTKKVYKKKYVNKMRNVFTNKINSVFSGTKTATTATSTAAKTAAKTTTKVASTTVGTLAKTPYFWIGVLVVVIVFLVILLFSSMVAILGSSSGTALDIYEVQKAELYYRQLEATYEYETGVSLDHDPIDLASYLAVCFPDFEFDEIAEEFLDELFEKQKSVKNLTALIVLNLDINDLTYFEELYEIKLGFPKYASPFSFDYEPYISSYIGYRINPTSEETELQLHKGLDIAVPEGTEILAIADGTVSKAYYSSSYGNVVVILHDDGYSSLYAHQSAINVVKGQRVSQGDVIGYVGSTGDSTGNHLHLEIYDEFSELMNTIYFLERFDSDVDSRYSNDNTL